MLRDPQHTLTGASWVAILLALTWPLLLTACAAPPPPLAGTFQEITVEQAQWQDLTGQRVRWGGTIITATPSQNDTCFEIVSRPLDGEARPQWTDQTSGRFLACAQGFYDPAVYGVGREITVVGTLQPSVVRKIGEHDYRYPQVSVEQLYLWPERVPREVYYPSWPGGPWYSGWWESYGPYDPWFYEPYWGPWMWWSPPVVWPGPLPPPHYPHDGGPHPGMPHPRPHPEPGGHVPSAPRPRHDLHHGGTHPAAPHPRPHPEPGGHAPSAPRPGSHPRSPGQGRRAGDQR